MLNDVVSLGKSGNLPVSLEMEVQVMEELPSGDDGETRVAHLGCRTQCLNSEDDTAEDCCLEKLLAPRATVQICRTLLGFQW